MNHEVDWTYLYPSFGLLMRAFDMEAKQYEEGFAITPNRVTITYKDALNAYKFFVLHAINDSLPDEMMHYDAETIYYSLCYLMNIVTVDYSHFSHYYTKTEQDDKITFLEALTVFRNFVEASFDLK